MAKRSKKLDINEDEDADHIDAQEQAQADEIADKLDIPEDETDESMIELEDGSVVINFPDVKGPRQDPEHFENLAEHFEDHTLLQLASDLLRLIKLDEQSRESRDKLYEEGLRRTGMGEPAPGGGLSPSSSKVTHPVLAEAIVDFAARSTNSITPPGDLVRTALKGIKEDDDQLERADRKGAFLNWQLNTQVEEFRRTSEELFTQLPLGGSQYKKWSFDPDLKRPRVEFLPIDRVLLPFNAGSFYTSPRVTEVEDVDFETVRLRTEQGLYRELAGLPIDDVDPLNPDTTTGEFERSLAQMANDKIEGQDEPEMDADGTRRLYHVYTWLRLKEDNETKGDRAPYIVTIDLDQEDIFALYRNWEANDNSYTKLDWIVDYTFIPWRGPMGIGLVHLMGSLAASATGALRALLDSAHASNMPAMASLKGGLTGVTAAPEPGQVIELEAPGADDVRKLLMPMPFNPPNPVLYQLLEWLTQSAKGIVSTSEEAIADAGNSMQVGTAQALLESSSRTISSIHARMHRAMAKELEVLSRINYFYLDKMNNRSGVKIAVADFADSTDITPISDPNIFSETQRQMMAQQVLALSLQAKDPKMYDEREVHKNILKSMKVPYIEEVLPDPHGTVDSNPVLENFRMSMPNQASAAFPDQDHLAHLSIHLEFALNPATGGSPLLGPTVVTQILEHIKQHISLYYLQTCIDFVKMDDADSEDIFELHRERPLSKLEQQSLAMMIQSKVSEHVQDTMKEYIPLIAQLQEKASKLQQAHQESAMMADPSAAVLLKTEQFKLQFQQEQAKGEFGLKAKELEVKFQTEIDKLAAKYDEIASKAEADDQLDGAKNATALAIASMNNESHERIEQIKIAQAASADQMQLEHERNMAATVAAQQAQQELQTHGLDMEKQEAANQAQQAQTQLEQQPVPVQAPMGALPEPQKVNLPPPSSMAAGGLAQQIISNDLGQNNLARQSVVNNLQGNKDGS